MKYLTLAIIIQIIYIWAQLLLTSHVTNYGPAKTVWCEWYSPIFKAACNLNSLHLVWKLNMLGFLSLNITSICSLKPTVFLELCSICFTEQIMSTSKIAPNGSHNLFTWDNGQNSLVCLWYAENKFEFCRTKLHLLNWP